MKWFIARARAILSVQFAAMAEYRIELFFWMLATALPLIMMGLWIEAVRRGDFGMTEAEVARYFLAVFLVRQFSIVWVIYEFEYHVIKGQLSPYLLQPIDPVWRWLGAHVAEQAARAPLVFGMVALFLFLYPAAIWSGEPGHETLWLPSLRAVGAAIVATWAAFLLRFVIQYTLALAAFWIEKPTAIDNFIQMFYLYLSGIVAPLAFYPDAVRQAALWTPFPYVVWFPATVLTGNNTVPFAQGMLILAAWSFGLFAVNRIVWRMGLRRYSAMGA